MFNRLVFEDKLNVILSELLNQSGVVSRSEYLFSKGRKDIIVYHQGLEIVLEGSYSKEDAEEDAKRRIEQLACDIAIAICYPKKFYQSLSDIQIKKDLKNSNFLVKIIISKDIQDTLTLFPCRKRVAEAVTCWQDYNLDSLDSLISEAGEFIITEESMKEIEKEVYEFIEDFIGNFSSHNQTEKIAKNLYHILYELYGFSIGDPVKIKEAIFAQACLAILLSSIYYETIRYIYGLETLDNLAKTKGSQFAICKATEDIIKINYEPIFEITQAILQFFPQSPQLFDRLINLAIKVSSKRTLLRKDIAGRIYHKVVGDWSVKKGLATFYTQIPAAYFLLYLAEPKLSKICDFACGSGTLLTAAYSAANKQYRFSLLKNGLDKNPSEIEKEFHTKFIKSCYGFDVLNYATQITALNLAFHSPETPLVDFSLYPIPLGYRKDLELVSLGSLEIVREEPTLNFMKKLITKTGLKEKKEVSLSEILSELNSPDLITMNPPFTRATGRSGRKGGGLFGFMVNKNTREEVLVSYKRVRARIRKSLNQMAIGFLKNRDLNELLKDREFQAYRSIGQSGEGLLFLYLAHIKIKEQGKICFVLPKSLLSGITWFLARCMLISNYHIEHLVVSYDSSHGYNFSESTSLSECLLVAKKVREHSENEKTKFIILLSKPKTSMEAIALSNKTKEKKEYIEVGDAKAFIVENSREEMIKYVDNWGRFIFLPNLLLIREIKDLLNGIIRVGGVKSKIPLIRLNALTSSIGIDRHQFLDNYEIVSGNIPGSFKVIYGGKEEHRKKMKILANDYVLPKNRGSSLFEEKKGRLFLPDRIWLDTAHIISMISENPTLSNIFYALQLKDENENKLKALCLYINTTWGILTVLANRGETRGAWIQLKMNQWRLLPVLDISKLSEDKIEKLAGVFDKFKDKELERIPIQYGVDGKIDKLRVELDLAFLAVMNISVKEKDLRLLYKEIASALKQWIGN